MSNYFKLIQNVSIDYLGKAPTLFTDTTNKKYNQIIREIKQATDAFMLDSFHSFRRKETTLNTVIGQQKYIHNYDNIDEIIITGTDGNKTTLNFVTDYKEFLKRPITNGTPTEYTIFNNKIYLDATPDAVYTLNILYLTRNFVKGVYTIDTSSASGQTKLYLASTTGLTAGQSLTVEADTDREETIIIDSVTTDDYITATANLTYSHASGTAEIYKRTFVYETDEPNFPDEYHDIVEYAALMRLYYDDRDNLAKFSGLYRELYTSFKMESRQTTDCKPYFKIIGG